MHTRIALIALLGVLCIPRHVYAEKVPPSSNALLQAVIDVVQSRSINSVRAFFARTPRPAFNVDDALFVDRDAIAAQLRPLGFVSDFPSAESRVNELTFRNRAWDSLKSCSQSASTLPLRCTIPARTVVVRFFDPKWIIPDVEIRVEVGVYHRTEGVLSGPGIGGSAVEYFFVQKGGRWTLSRVGTAYTS